MSEEDDQRAREAEENRRAWEAWEAEEERKRKEAEQPQSKEGVEPLAVTPGTAILATATIDSLFTALFATRSPDLVAAGTPTYSWGAGNMIIAQWPTLQVGATPSVPNYSAMFCRFEARSDLARGSSIAQ